MMQPNGGGRFAPSPTGDLHFGSLLAAVASLCEARSKNLPWRLRIDDIDGPRSVAGSAESIQVSLHRYGMRWDGDILWQSQHQLRYREALASLIQQGLVFACHCSRRSLPVGQVYPGTCRANRVHSTDPPLEDAAYRIVMPDTLEFTDGVQGVQKVLLSDDVGDIIIWRRDKLVSYSLACAIDDASDCHEVVRGADLLPSTAAQIALMHYLSMTPPRYAHIPVAVDARNDKLSKHSKAPAISSMDPLKTLHRAWRFLGQRAIAAGSTAAFWDMALASWQLEQVPGVLRLLQPDQ